MDPSACPRCNDTEVELDADGGPIPCRGCVDACVADDSTECDCSTCVGREEAWQRLQGWDADDGFAPDVGEGDA